MEAILDTLRVIVDYIGMMISSTVSLVTMIPDLYMSLTASFTYAPTFLSGFLNLSGAVTLLFAVIRLVT